MNSVNRPEGQTHVLPYFGLLLYYEFQRNKPCKERKKRAVSLTINRGLKHVFRPPFSSSRLDIYMIFFLGSNMCKRGNKGRVAERRRRRKKESQGKGVKIERKSGNVRYSCCATSTKIFYSFKPVASSTRSSLRFFFFPVSPPPSQRAFMFVLSLLFFSFPSLQKKLPLSFIFPLNT